jgi:ribosomal protein L25 (general stress protein Ctc)
MDKQVLIGEARKILGRNVKHLRKDGILPGNIFGKKIKSEAVQVNFKDFMKVYKRSRGDRTSDSWKLVKLKNRF